MFNLVKQLIVFIYVTIKRLLASLILFNILGWRMTQSYNSCFQYRKDRHVIIYAHTSSYDAIIGYLIYTAYDIPVVGVAKQELSQVPILGYLMKHMDVIFIDRVRNTNTAKFISDELDKKRNFVFVIAPEGSRNKMKDIRSGFYYISANTHSNLHIIRLNYESQTITIDNIASANMIQTLSYDKIKNITIDEMKKECPYHPDSYHLITKPDSKTSIININRSWLIYVLPLIVLYIMISSLYCVF